MSKLCASISFQHKIDEAKAIKQQKLKEDIAEPIVPIVIDDDDEENPINLEIQKENPTDFSDNDDDENDESQASTNWNNLINTWKELLLQEEEAENEAENDLEGDYDTEINEFLLNRTHPALDNEAKWNIERIFVDNLAVPFFIDNNS